VRNESGVTHAGRPHSRSRRKFQQATKSRSVWSACALAPLSSTKRFSDAKRWFRRQRRRRGIFVESQQKRFSKLRQERHLRRRACRPNAGAAIGGTGPGVETGETWLVFGRQSLSPGIVEANARPDPTASHLGHWTLDIGHLRGPHNHLELDCQPTKHGSRRFPGEPAPQ
jgi:hypothetical protein